MHDKSTEDRRGAPRVDDFAGKCDPNGAGEVATRARRIDCMPRFQIVTTDGDALGPVELDRPDWPAGSVIRTGRGEPNLRVLRHLEVDGDEDDPELFTVLIVELAD